MIREIALSTHQLQEVLYELRQKHPNLNKIGKATQESAWGYFVNSLSDQPQPRWLELIQKINCTFAQLEQKGIKFFDPTIQDEKFLEKARCYRAKRRIYLDTAEGVSHQIEALQMISPELEQACHELKCRMLGLRYSLGSGNGGLDPLEEPDQESLDKLTLLAQQWKEKQKLAVEKELDELQQGQLKELARYPEWLEVVIQNREYLAEVFNWSLHNFQRVEIIVKNYEMRRKIKAALLPANLGYARNVILTQPENEVIAYATVPTKVAHVTKRILTAAIYHGNFNEFQPDQQERVNILQPQKNLHFKQGNYYLTVKELLEELAQKNKREANVILCGEWGFVNFHPVKGVWNADQQKYEMPPITQENWTDYVPPSRIATHAELLAQYGDEVKKCDFFFKVMSTRQYKNLNALDCHAYLQIFKRMKDGNWKVINVGFYAFRYQQDIIDGLWLFCATLQRVVCLLDQNCYFTHRQRGGFPVFCSEEAKQELLQRLFDAIHTKAVFQFSGRNCAYTIQRIIEDLIEKELIKEEIPNFFRMPLTMAKTGLGPLDWLFAWAHGQWEWVRWLVLTLVHTCFLSHRREFIGDEEYSVREYFNKHGHIIYNPSYLHWQIDQAHQTGEGPFVKGEIYYSHTEEKIYQKQVLTQQQEDEDIDML